MRQIYFDYAATTPVDPSVMEAMLPVMTKFFGNPSSIHAYGRAARSAVAEARAQVASLLNAEPQEIFFTSGGSESDNWILKGMAFQNRLHGNHIITTSIEHHAVLNTCRWLESQGFEVTYLSVDAAGRVSPETVEAAITERTVLISIMAANNEVGTIEPLEQIGTLARERGICFHTDAVQAAGHIPLDVKQLKLDALSLSGHKLYGPKGIGALYIRRGIQPESLIHGGMQERGMRAGTENTAAIVGLGVAAQLAAVGMQTEMAVLSELRAVLFAGLQQIDQVWLNGPRQNRLPGNLNFGVQGVSSEALLIRLDLAGFAVSSGSACSAGAIEPSHVLRAMGQSDEAAKAAIRVTLGRYTTKSDVEAFLAALQKIIAEIRQMKVK